MSAIVPPVKPSTTEKAAFVAELQDLLLTSTGLGDGVEFDTLNCALCEGDYRVVIGGAGSGKSRLIETLAGFARPSAGVVRLFGHDTTLLRGDDWVELRRRVGLVFEEGSRLFPQMTVRENVGLPLCYHQNRTFEEVDAQVGKLLELTGISHLKDRLPTHIGRNWRTRVGLARALATKPGFLLLDNPLAGLDHEQAAWWVAFLGDLSKGHEWTGGAPVTILATAEDSTPWKGSGCQFTFLRDGKWTLEKDPGSEF